MIGLQLVSVQRGVLLFACFLLFLAKANAGGSNDESRDDGNEMQIQEAKSFELAEANSNLLCLAKILQDFYRLHGKYMRGDDLVGSVRGTGDLDCMKSVQIISGQLRNNFGDTIEYVRLSDHEALIFSARRNNAAEISDGVKGFRLDSGRLFDYEMP